MKTQVLINVEDKDIRVAVLEDGDLVQLFIEQMDDKSIVGNVYKARVESVVPGLQAAFVNLGLERNAFLHFNDIEGDLIPPGEKGRRGKNKREISRGDEVLVQVLKEPMSTKGARVTMNVSIPGRYLVLLPFSSGNGGGVSRRIEDSGERKRLRSILKRLDADNGSFIVRTAGLEQDESEIRADVEHLQKTWSEIEQQGNSKKQGPYLIYDDHDILGRIVRDELSNKVDHIYMDSREDARRLRRILGTMIPYLKRKVTVHEDLSQNLFERYGVEQQYQQALKRKVWLESGGYIIVDETEALIAIDVNSGKFVGKSDQEAMILQTNLEASDEISRQLRLRDMGGIVVVDFIDMKPRENQRKVEQHFRQLLKKDRAKTTTSPLSDLGLLEMTRKRVRQSLSKVIFQPCPYCEGSGRVLNEQQIWKDVKYDILNRVAKNKRLKSIEVRVHPSLRTYVENEVLDGARALATRSQVALNFVEDPACHLEHYEIAES